ncbi:MAG: hypothetical protein AABM33_18605, partial [Pseudomonadota bacterium]
MIYAASLLVATLGILSFSAAQERAVPKEAKGGVNQGEPWSLVPKSFQDLKKIPQWPLPTNLQQWRETDRVQTRQTLLRLLGD